MATGGGVANVGEVSEMDTAKIMNCKACQGRHVPPFGRYCKFVVTEGEYDSEGAEETTRQGNGDEPYVGVVKPTREELQSLIREAMREQKELEDADDISKLTEELQALRLRNADLRAHIAGRQASQPDDGHRAVTGPAPATGPTSRSVTAQAVSDSRQQDITAGLRGAGLSPSMLGVGADVLDEILTPRNPPPEYQYDETAFKVTDEMKAVFDWDGCLIVRGLLDRDEVNKINTALTGPDSVVDQAWDLADGEGRASRLVLWSHPGNDITGLIARAEKVGGTAEQLLGGEVYHYHTKLMMKEPRTGGKHLWHQDYGYWYKNGCLKPDMMTAFIAMDRCVKENGCLEVLIGSHRCGRIEHVMQAGQTMADMQRVSEITKQFPHTFVCLEPGDCLFFHCNLLHTSQKNDSDMRRWCFLVAYNRADNDPVIKHHHPNYTPLVMVPNEAIRTCTNMDLSGKDVLDPSTDKTVIAERKKTGFH